MREHLGQAVNRVGSVGYYSVPVPQRDRRDPTGAAWAIFAAVPPEPRGGIGGSNKEVIQALSRTPCCSGLSNQGRQLQVALPNPAAQQSSSPTVAGSCLSTLGYKAPSTVSGTSGFSDTTG